MTAVTNSGARTQSEDGARHELIGSSLVRTSATAVIPLWDRAAEWQARLRMIDNSERYLLASTYFIQGDSYGLTYLEALAAAQLRGVQTILLIDALGQKLARTLMNKQELQQLAQALDRLRQRGGIVTFYKPRRRWQRFIGGGQHVKIQVSEKDSAIFGSSNLSHLSFERWNELSLQVHGPIVHAMRRTLLGLLPHMGGRVPELEPAAPAPGNDGVPLIYAYSDPATSPNNSITALLVERLGHAQKHVCISSLYFKPCPQLLEAVLDCARRGVRVEIFHSHRQALPASGLPWVPAAAQYRPLLKAGVTIRENRRGEHSKVVLIDDRWCALGSYNFEYAAHDRLVEGMVASEDPTVCAFVHQMFSALRSTPDNVLIERASLGKWSALLRAQQVLLTPVGRWL